MEELVIDKNGYVIFYAAAEYNGKLYISDRDNKGLLEYDLTTKETVIKKVFMVDGYMNNYGQAFSYMNEIWFMPIRDYMQIAIYNVDSNNIEYLDVPRSEHRCDYIPFSYFIKRNEYVYLQPAHYDCMLKINMKNRVMSRISIGVEKYSGSGYPTISAAITYGDLIYMCPFNNDEFIVFDMKTESVIKRLHLNKIKAYTNLFFNKGKVCLVPLKVENGLTLLDVDKEIQTKIEIDCDEKYKECEYIGSIVEDKEIILFPQNGNIIIKYNFSDKKISYIRFNIKNNADKMNFNRSRVIGNGKYFVSSVDNKTPCILFDNGKIDIVDAKLRDDYFIKELLMEIEEKEKNDICNSSNI